MSGATFIQLCVLTTGYRDHVNAANFNYMTDQKQPELQETRGFLTVAMLKSPIIYFPLHIFQRQTCVFLSFCRVKTLKVDVRAFPAIVAKRLHSGERVQEIQTSACGSIPAFRETRVTPGE